MSILNSSTSPNCENLKMEPYSCKDCAFTTNLYIFLKKHLEDVHTIKPRSEDTIPQFAVQDCVCKHCYFETSSSLQWLKHGISGCQRFKNDEHLYFKTYSCQFCEFETNLVIFLSKHIQDCHVVVGMQKKSKLKSYFICKSCSFETGTFLEWRNHVMVGCSNLEPSKSIIQYNPPRKRKEFFNCKHCIYTTTDIRYFKQHMIKHTPDSEIEWCRCDLCPYKAKNKGSLTMHRYRHFRQKQTLVEKQDSYNCDHCNFSSKFRANMRRHLVDFHKDEAQIQCFRCDHCTYTALFKEDLTKHKIRHEEKQLYQCQQCSYIAKKRWRLNAHIIAKHQPQTSDINCYKCDQCSFRSVLKAALKKHVINKHLSEEDIQWHQCQLCPYRSKLKHNLKKHVWLRHTDADLIKCDQCDYATKLKVVLERHKITRHLTEEEIQWFQCPECPYRGKMKRDLKAHELRVHTNRKQEDKDFKCDVCGVKAKSKYRLNEHKKSHKESTC